MSKAVIGWAAAALLLGSACAYLSYELRAAREQTTELQARIAELEYAQRSARAVETPNTFPPPTTVSSPLPPETKTQPAVVQSAPNVALAASGPRMDPQMRRRLQQNFEQQQRLLQDPEYRELMRSQQKAGMKRMYGDLELMLGLSKEEADRVLDILAEQQLRSSEQRPLMMGMDGTAPETQAIREQQRAFAELKRSNDAELAAALGPKYGEWQSYQQNSWSRQQVMQLREALAGSNEPLRQDQIKPLVEALVSEQQQMQMKSTSPQISANGRMTRESQLRMQEDWLERTTQSHERIRSAVSGLLSPSQLAQLQEQQDQQRKMQELSVRMQRARLSEAQANGEDPASEAAVGLATNSLVIN